MSPSRAPVANDGMGSLCYPDGTCRFRVWAPFAKAVRVEGDFTGWSARPVDLTAEGNGNWSAVVPGVSALQMYKYTGSPTSAVRGMTTPSVGESRHPGVAGRELGFRCGELRHRRRSVQRTEQPPSRRRVRKYLVYQLHVGSFAGRNDLRAQPVRNFTATFLDVIEKLPYIKISASMRSNSCPSASASAT